jgi:hypothetical protein
MACVNPVIAIDVQECDEVYRGNMTVKHNKYDAYISIIFQFNDTH